MSAVAASVTAVVALISMVVAFSEPKKSQERARYYEAARVSVYIDYTLLKRDLENRTYVDPVVTIRNNSSMPVRATGLYGVGWLWWSEAEGGQSLDGFQCPTSSIGFDPLTLSPFSEKVVPLDGVEHRHFIVAEFQDAYGDEWRRRSDTQLLERMPYQQLMVNTRIRRVVNWIVGRSRLARWAHQKAALILLSVERRRNRGVLRLTRLFGATGGGEPISEWPDPWLRPEGAPDEWWCTGVMRVRAGMKPYPTAD